MNRIRFLAAEAALERGDAATFQRLLDTLRDYPLYPDLVIAALLKRLDGAAAHEVAPLLARYAGTAPGERLRRLWLARLARERRWSEYTRDFVDNGSDTRACLYRRALIETGRADEAFAGLAAVYARPDSLPDACDPLFAAWRAAGGLTPELVWQRVAALLDADLVAVARHQRHYLPASDQPWLERWLNLHAQPAMVTQPFPGDHPQRAAIIAHGLARLARQDPARARQAWRAIGQREALPTHASTRALVAIGLAFAERGATEDAIAALSAPLDGRAPTALRLARARAGLELRAWRQLPAWIAALDAEERDSALWRYWEARALRQTGAVAPALVSWRVAAADRSLWGFLAAERLGVAPRIAHRPVALDPARLKELLAAPTAARIRELQALRRPIEIKREWRAYTAPLDVAGLSEAAVLAARLDLPTLAIFTLARGDCWDDLELRFPIRHQPLVRQAARVTDLPDAWILAVIRQESAFDAEAGSQAGALGLMQLLPSTAHEVAVTQGLTPPSRRDLLDPALNIALGSRYMATLRQRFGDHAALATAAYNAGPTRVRRWLPAQSVETDLWIATIPFRETRDYVSRVLAYRVLYAWRLDGAVPGAANPPAPPVQDGAGDARILFGILPAMVPSR